MDHTQIQHGIDKAYVNVKAKHPAVIAELEAAGFHNTNNMYKYESAMLRKTVYYTAEDGKQAKAYSIIAVVFDMTDLGTAQKVGVTYHACLGAGRTKQTDIEFGSEEINKPCVQEALQRMQTLFEALGSPHYE